LVGFFIDLYNFYVIILIMINIKSCIGKKVVYKQSDDPILREGNVIQVIRDTVLIDTTWFESSSIVVKHVLPNSINESGGIGDTLING